MKKLISSVLLLLIIFVGVIIISSCKKEEAKNEINKPVSIPENNMKLSSPAFENNQSIPSKYACDGENINPPLEISEVPEGARSSVLIVDDPDAPGGDWVHWTIWNISPDTKEIYENSVPQGVVEGKTDFGRPGYGGPCPPSGAHRYQFKIYALDTDLNLNSSSTKKDIERAIEGHILDQAILIGTYQRQ